MKHRCSICDSVFNFDYRPGHKLPPYFPFCSERCKLLDLNRWLNEDYRISVPLPSVGFDTPSATQPKGFITDDEKREIAELLLETGEVDTIIDEDVKVERATRWNQKATKKNAKR